MGVFSLSTQVLNLVAVWWQAIPGIPKIENGKNPATWMLEVTAPPMEAQLDIDFADTFAKSPIYRYAWLCF